MAKMSFPMDNFGCTASKFWIFFFPLKNAIWPCFCDVYFSLKQLMIQSGQQCQHLHHLLGRKGIPQSRDEKGALAAFLAAKQARGWGAAHQTQRRKARTQQAQPEAAGAGQPLCWPGKTTCSRGGFRVSTGKLNVQHRRGWRGVSPYHRPGVNLGMGPGCVAFKCDSLDLRVIPWTTL